MKKIRRIGAVHSSLTQRGAMRVRIQSAVLEQECCSDYMPDYLSLHPDYFVPIMMLLILYYITDALHESMSGHIDASQMMLND